MFFINHDVNYKISTSSCETLHFKKCQKREFFDQILPKLVPQEQLSQQSQQLIFQLMDMGDRVTCIGVFNENIVHFWWFLR